MTDQPTRKPPYGPAHPRWGAALSGAPKIVDGVTFYPYRTGVNRYVRSDGDRIEIFGAHGESKIVRVDGESIYSPRKPGYLGVPRVKRFRKFETAARAGIAALKAADEAKS